MVTPVTSALLVATSLIFVTAQSDWNYEENGPSTWPRNYPLCDDDRQSPIALHKDTSGKDLLLSPFIHLRFRNYDSPVNGVFTNNGHTVNLVLNYDDPSEAAQVLISGIAGQGLYRLGSLHFHWPAEHTINGERYDLELHMVHTDSSTNRTLVLGYTYKGCQQSTTGINKLASTLPQVINYEDSVRISNFVPESVMPRDYKCNYFIYSGSLTTPPCSEGVTWLVYRKTSCIDKNQLAKFNAILNEEGTRLYGNYRPIQKRNGRQIYQKYCFGLF